MQPQPSIWHSFTDPGRLVAGLRPVLAAASAAGLEPRLLETAKGSQALALPRGPALLAFAVAPAATDTEPETTTDDAVLAVLAIAAGEPEPLLVEELSAALAATGQALALVALPKTDAREVPGLGPPVSQSHAPGPALRIHPVAPPRGPKTGEGKTNLRDRAAWFQRRTGGG